MTAGTTKGIIRATGACRVAQPWKRSPWRSQATAGHKEQEGRGVWGMGGVGGKHSALRRNSGGPGSCARLPGWKSGQAHGNWVDAQGNSHTAA